MTDRLYYASLVVTVVAAITAGTLLTDPGPDGTVVAEEQLASGATQLTVTIDGTNETRIRYDWDDRTYEARYFPRYRRSLEFLRANTTRDATVAAWWDYGHTIRGHARRTVVAATPSPWVYRYTVPHDGAWPARAGRYTRHRTLQDLATMLLARNASASAAILDRYGADYLYITGDDLSKLQALIQTATRQPDAGGQINTLSCLRSTEGGCATNTQENVTFYTYNAEEGTVLVPFREVNGQPRIIDTPVIRRGENMVAITTVCTPFGTETYSAPPRLRTGDGCIAFHPDSTPDRLLYIPEAAVDSMLVRLYVMDGAGVARFRNVHDGPHAEVWQPLPSRRALQRGGDR